MCGSCCESLVKSIQFFNVDYLAPMLSASLNWWWWWWYIFFISILFSKYVQFIINKFDIKQAQVA